MSSRLINPLWLRSALVALTTALSAGCATAPAHITELSDREICRGYGIYSAWFISHPLAEQYKGEIERRKLVTSEEWSLVAQERIQKGMSWCALYASWGVPISEHPSDRDEGEIQHVYHTGWRISPGSVYTKNGKVEAWGY
ncbi:hypothetical protein [Methylocaldum sp.]|uniref:hypothetical protein n=1 Tax=Methylocaldum sp. TaxID=1969727 RepID=UPI002D2DD134|nr:hypothetical protein [Methylocaldum sp.]HYE33897.1 hypothetical protein [Methylocaldum sp.]